MHCEICQGLHCVQHLCDTATIRNLKQNKIKVRILFRMFRVPLFSNHIETMKIKVSRDNLVLNITPSWISFLPTGLGANAGNKLLCKMTVCFGMSTIPTIRQWNINMLQIHPYPLTPSHFSLQKLPNSPFFQPSTNNPPAQPAATNFPWRSSQGLHQEFLGASGPQRNVPTLAPTTFDESPGLNNSPGGGFLSHPWHLGWSGVYPHLHPKKKGEKMVGTDLKCHTTYLQGASFFPPRFEVVHFSNVFLYFCWARTSRKVISFIFLQHPTE